MFKIVDRGNSDLLEVLRYFYEFLRKKALPFLFQQCMTTG
jgi:hypothetical protein